MRVLPLFRRTAFLRAALPAAACVAAALTVAGCATSAAPAASGPATFHVDVGFEDAAQALEVEAFFPQSLTVNAGDSVVFTMRSHEAHTITFNSPNPVPDPFVPQPDHSLAANPAIFFSSPPSMPGDPKQPVMLKATFDGTGYVNSGFLQKPGDTFTVTFPAPGTYEALCLLHFKAMKATIVVNPADSARTMTDADLRTAASAKIKEVEARAAALLAGVSVPAPMVNADGTRSYEVYAGVGNEDGIDYMRFVGGEKLSIKVGDSVTFEMAKNAAGVPHTVTFLSGTDDPDLILPQAQPGGPPKLLVNPRVVVPAPLPPAPYDGSAYANSGLLITGAPVTPQKFTVTYTKAGTFSYQCIFHDDEGMKGTVTVQQ